MDNKDLYRETFSKVHTLNSNSMEDYTVRVNKSRLPKNLVACVIAISVLFTSTTLVNAATDGNFYEGIRVFFNGKEVDPMEVGSLDKNGNYKVAAENSLEEIKTIDIMQPSSPDKDSIYRPENINPTFLAEKGKFYLVFYGTDKHDITDKFVNGNEYISEPGDWVIQGISFQITAGITEDGEIEGSIKIIE